MEGKSCIFLVPIFNHLEAGQMAEIMEVVKSVSYKKGEIIYRAGDQSNALYIVSKGKIKIYRLSESGRGAAGAHFVSRRFYWRISPI